MLFDLMEDLKRDEGVRHKPYRDTVGKLTIGVGRNLDDVGLRDSEVWFLLYNDAQQAMADARKAIPSFDELSEPRKRALANMVFNLGLPRFLGFENMLTAIEYRDFDKAASEALNSRWANQVGARAERIANMLRQG